MLQKARLPCRVTVLNLDPPGSDDICDGVDDCAGNDDFDQDGDGTPAASCGPERSFGADFGDLDEQIYP